MSSFAGSFVWGLLFIMRINVWLSIPAHATMHCGRLVLVGWVAVPVSSSTPMPCNNARLGKGEVGWVGGTDRRIRFRNYVRD